MADREVVFYESLGTKSVVLVSEALELLFIVLSFELEGQNRCIELY